jgi:VWFA-related protein
VSSTSRRFLAGLALVCAAVALITAQAQNPAGTTQNQQPRFRTEANFVRVDAYPTKSGNPVQDLEQSEFEVLEDGVRQTIESFEHVVIRPAGPQTERLDPGSQREMLQAAQNPRNRVFVIFLDAPHVTVEASHNIKEPLIRLLDRILGPDDLVGIMTPEMDPTQITLGRKTEVMEEQLRRHWPWGVRDSIIFDETEQSYIACYPPLMGERGTESALAREMIARKRERATLESLQDLVRYLQAIREERKAIITVSNGWLLYREDQSLMKLRKDPVSGVTEPVPTGDPVTVGPGGKLTTKDPRKAYQGESKEECNTDRMRLAMMDDDHFFRTILDDANRANASFYPVDPRGLAVFDNSIGPNPPPPITVDAQMLRGRLDSLRVLALNTDGIAVVDSNDLDRGLKRISEDLTSYYLLGYYSSNSKLDGGFRSIKVRVTRPGVDVRARRGYRAATPAEVTAARKAAEGPSPVSSSVLDVALKNLARIRPDARVRIYAAPMPGARLVWVSGELPSTNGRSDEWAQGGTADVQVTAGATSATSRVTMKPGERTFITPVSIVVPEDVTDIDVQARLTATDATTPPVTDGIRVTARTDSVTPLLFRRGPTTGNRQLPAADLRFSRIDRVRLEAPIGPDDKPGDGRVLDRNGQPLGVPLTVGERTDAASGQRWLTADLNLAPLAPGDYGIEVGVLRSGIDARVITAIRVVR